MRPDTTSIIKSFPSWKYIGQKRQTLSQIIDFIDIEDAKTSLELFGGSGLFTYILGVIGKKSHYNELLPSTSQFFTGLLNSDPIPLDLWQEFIMSEPVEDPILSVFSGYFSYSELAQMEGYIKNIEKIDRPLTRSIFLFILTQATLIKKSGGNFHGKGNTKKHNEFQSSLKDQPFSSIMMPIFDNVNKFLSVRKIKGEITTSNLTWSNLDTTSFRVDLIFADPPYSPSYAGGRQLGNYAQSYHFLEALTNYPNIDFNGRKTDSQLLKFRESNHLVLENKKWIQPEFIAKSFESLGQKCRNTQLLLTYRKNGQISLDQLKNILGTYFNTVSQYALEGGTHSNIREYLILCNN